MQLWVGLGNPGAKYALQRHNVGFMAADVIAEVHDFGPWQKKFRGLIAEGRIGRNRILLLKPQTFMNDSGDAVQQALRFYKLEMDALTVFHDELDLAPFKVKVKLGGGTAGHNGLRSIREHRYAGYTSYASLNDLPKRDPAFADLARLLTRHAVKFADACAFDLPRKPRLDSLWVNLLKCGGQHSGHIHPHSIISGTFYVEAPPDSGAIRFEDPRLPLMMAAPPRRKDAPEELQPFVTIPPRPGLLLMWESWLRHEVLPGTGRGERLSV